MTSLARQLERLAVPQTASLLQDKRRVSFLFDPREASNLDRDTVFSIGINGLHELINIDSSFAEYEDSLFNETSTNFERSVQTKEVNDKVDIVIATFLVHLSPYFPLRPAHKALEWLVYRYHIHQYNVDALMACILPHHTSKIFIRALQLLQLSDPHSRWNWMQSLQKPGLPLPRSTVINHCYKDASFLNFVCEMIPKSLKVHETSSTLQVVLAFYSSTVMGALEYCDTVSDTMLSGLVPYITKGLRSKINDYKLATYMILSQLVSKVQLSAKLLSPLMKTLMKHMSARYSTEALICMLVIFQYQNIKELSKKTFKYLCKVPGLVQILSNLSTSYDIKSLLAPLMDRLIPGAVWDTETMATSSDAGEGLLLGAPEYCSILEGLLQDIRLDDSLASQAISNFFKEYNSCKEGKMGDKATIEALNGRVKSWLRLMERRYPEQMDKMLSFIMADTQTDRDTIQDFTSLLMSSVKHDVLPDSLTSLTLSLSHPQTKVRECAVKYLIDKCQSAELSHDPEFYKDSFLQRLNDDSPDVVSAVLSQSEVLLKVVDVKILLEVLKKLLCRTKHQPSWREVHKAVLILLCGESTITSLQPEVLGDIIITALPFTIVADQNSSLAAAVMDSELSRCHCLVSQFTQEWLTQQRTKKANINKLNSILIKGLGKCLIAMEKDILQQFLTRMTDRASSDDTLQFMVMSMLAESLKLAPGDDVSRLLLLKAQLSCLTTANDKQDVSILKSLTLDTALTQFSHSEGLVETVRSLSNGGPIPPFVIAGYMHKLVTSMTSPHTERVWWKLDDSREFQFFVEVFDFLMTWSSKANVFRHLINHLMQTCFDSAENLMKFLSMLCVGSEDPSCQVTPVLQLRALKITSIELKKERQTDIMSALDTVVPSLVCSVSSSHREVREQSMTCFERMLQILPEGGTTYHRLINKLVDSREELVTDPDYLQQVMVNLYGCLSRPIESLGLTPRKTKKLKTKQDQLRVEYDSLIKCLTSEDSPTLIKSTVMKSFTLIHDKNLLIEVAPLLQKLITKYSHGEISLLESELMLHLIDAFCPETARVLENNEVFQVFMELLGMSKDSGKIQKNILKQISKEFFSCVTKDHLRRAILEKLFDVITDTQFPDVASAVNNTIKHITLTSDFIIVELNRCIGSDRAKTLRQAKKARRSMKMSDVGTDKQQSIDRNWTRLTRILEAIEHKKKIKEPQYMLPVLFGLISQCLEHDDQSVMEYSKQLILSCILHTCNRLEHLSNTDGSISEEKFNVELIVQCIRSSDNPQTHRQALSLLTVAAKLFPEHVLHNIMSVFTFMGANLLRQDDVYSFQVMTKTIETVIPALLTAGSNMPQHAVIDIVLGILRVFVDAYPHIPTHRRLPLFSQLFNTMGSEQYLWVAVVLLLEKCVSLKQTAEDERDKPMLPAELEFCITLCNKCSPRTQVMCSKEVLSYLMQLPVDKPTETMTPTRLRRPSKKTSQSGGSVNQSRGSVYEELFHMNSHSEKQYRHFRFILISFLGVHLSSQVFVTQVLELAEEESKSIEVMYQELLEKIIKFIRQTARCLDDNVSTNTSKFWKALLHKSYEVLDKVTSLLPGNVFITVVSGLMSNDLHSVRRKALDLLNSKLHHQREPFSPTEEELLLSLISELKAVVLATKDSPAETEESDVIRQTALFSVKLLCKHLCEDHPDTFKKLLPTVVELMESEQSRLVLASALLCLAELVTSLHAHAIGHLSSFMPSLLRILETAHTSHEMLLVSAMTALHKIVDCLPHFLSPYLTGVITQIVKLSSLDEKGAVDKTNQKSQVYLRLKATRHLVAKSLATRVLIPAMCECYKNVHDKDVTCIGPLMSILNDHVTYLSKEDITSHQSDIIALIMEALDFRSQHPQLSLETVNHAEDHVIQTFITLVMRLSEQVFRPIFFKLYDWAHHGSHGNRLITFYSLADSLAGKLKGLFAQFAGHLVPNMAALLTSIKSGEPLFGAVSDDGGTTLLWTHMVDCLYQCFLYDTEGFLNKERFDSLVSPLTEQLDHQNDDERYQERISQHLVPCLSQMAVASGEDTYWRPLNYQVLLKTRHTSPQVRLAALQVVEAFNSCLGEDYMSMLPETIPFLAELLEDESYEVEEKCQQVISQMEKVLGQPLKKYF